jgi:hypothetical protein
VLWNDSSRTTSYVSPTQLTAAISAADVAAPQTAGVSVANPPPPGSDPNTAAQYVSSAATFFVDCGNQVSIDATSPALATIDKDVFGVNLTGAMDLTSSNGNYDTMMSTFRNANFGMVRWPLAAFSDYYQNTFTPFVMSAGAVYSRGEWLIPPTLGTKIIPMGAMRAMSWASCPAPLGIVIVVSPSPCAAPRVYRAHSNG